jgi:hypothetical protein
MPHGTPLPCSFLAVSFGISPDPRKHWVKLWWPETGIEPPPPAFSGLASRQDLTRGCISSTDNLPATSPPRVRPEFRLLRRLPSPSPQGVSPCHKPSVAAARWPVHRIAPGALEADFRPASMSEGWPMTQFESRKKRQAELQRRRSAWSAWSEYYSRPESMRWISISASARCFRGSSNSLKPCKLRAGRAGSVPHHA